MGLDLAGHPIGSEVKTSNKPGLMVNRHLSGYVAGTADLEKVEMIRNGEVIKTFEPKGYTFEFTYDDLKPFLEVSVGQLVLGSAFSGTNTAAADFDEFYSFDNWLTENKVGAYLPNDCRPSRLGADFRRGASWMGRGYRQP